MTAFSTTERRALRGPVRKKAASSSNRQHKAVPGFTVGDIYLVAMPDLSEVEVEDVVPAAQTIKIKGHGWIDLAAFEKAVKARLGHVIYTSGLFGLKRKFIRET